MISYLASNKSNIFNCGLEKRENRYCDLFWDKISVFFDNKWDKLR
jgi:hypothetical protein